MALNLGELTMQLGLDIASLDRDLKAAQAKIAQIGDTADANFAKANQSASGFGKTLSDVGKIAGGVLAGLVGFAALKNIFQGAAMAGVEWNKMLEVSAMKWETLLGSQEKAREQLKWMEQFAARTPFEFQELDKASSRFKAFGFTIEQTRTALQVLGDTAAATGTGAEGIQRLSLALGKIQANTRVTAREMLELTEMGIPAWEMLAKAMGLTVPELLKMSEKGLIPASKAIPMLLEGMNSAFGGQMQKQAETFTGKLSTLRDNVRILLGDAFRPLFEYLKNDALPKVMELTDKFAAALKTGGVAGGIAAIVPAEFKSLLEATSGAMSALLGLLKDIAALIAGALKGSGGILLDVITGWMQGLRTLVETMRNAFDAVSQYLVPIGKVLAVVFAPLIVAVGSVIAAGGLLIRHWEAVRNTALDIWGSIKAAFSGGVAFVLDTLSTFFAWTSRMLQSLLDYGARLIPGLGSVLQSLANMMAQAADSAAESAEHFRAAADEERKAISSRSDDIKTAAGADFYAEQSRQSAMDQSANVATAAAQDIKTAYGNMSNAAATSVAEQKEYLEAFATTFDNYRDDLLTKTKRSDEDQLTALKRANDQRLDEFKNAQERNKTAFLAGLDDRKTALERALQDELRTFEAAQSAQLRAYEITLREAEQAHQDSLDIRMTALEDAQKSEIEQYKRTQRDLLDAFRDRQRDELDAIHNRRDAERGAVDAAFDAAIKNLKAQEDAIQAREKQTALARQMASLQEKLADAERNLATARMAGDPAKIRAAEIDLAHARDAIAQESIKNAMDAERDRIRVQMDSLRTQQDQARKALDERFKAEEEAAKDRQAADLRHEQDRLADAVDEFKRRQDDQKSALDRELTGLKQAFADQQQGAIDHYKQVLDDQEKALQRQQADRQEAFKRELEALKASFKDRLSAQQTFLDDWAKSAATMAALEPPAVDIKPITDKILADGNKFVADWNASMAGMRAPAPGGGATAPAPGGGGSAIYTPPTIGGPGNIYGPAPTIIGGVETYQPPTIGGPGNIYGLNPATEAVPLLPGGSGGAGGGVSDIHYGADELLPPGMRRTAAGQIRTNDWWTFDYSSENGGYEYAGPATLMEIFRTLRDMLAQGLRNQSAPLQAQYQSMLSAAGMASGGIVMPTPGGTLIRAGEGGQTEVISPLARLSEMMQNYAADVMGRIQDFMAPALAMPMVAGAGGGDVYVQAAIYLGDSKLDEVIVKGLVTAKKRGRIKPDAF